MRLGSVNQARPSPAGELGRQAATNLPQRAMPTYVVLALILLLARPSLRLHAQGWVSRRVPAESITPSALARSPGPAWSRDSSRRFSLYAERGDKPQYVPVHLLDSLEAAWQHATMLLGVTLPDRGRTPVFVTRRATRFPHLLDHSNKGVTIGAGPRHAAVIVLVHNDTVRLLARHEVMHLVATDAWGRPSAGWISEGVAAWADGRCQEASVAAVARDLLRAEPTLRASTFMAEFPERARRDRASAYVLAGSLVAFVHARAGVVGVRQLWETGTVPTEGTIPGLDALTPAWRAAVERMAGTAPGLAPARLARFGCG